jgi:hypothetical protein
MPDPTPPPLGAPTADRLLEELRARLDEDTFGAVLALADQIHDVVDASGLTASASIAALALTTAIYSDCLDQLKSMYPERSH